ncbi:hypothetical protein AB0A69_02855 [Streptomyces sp. NPDC045431]|uniref:hypothetical protein n=1 Tax=Streptomyces sp. NPDC045431 TaxID=3155613 RepID=UPI0033CA8E87
MAKNRKQDRSQKQPAAAERGAPQAAGTMEAEPRMAPVTPADVAHKGRKKRFGHN